jgi:tetratricopeptide (TPR) repeat protein
MNKAARTSRFFIGFTSERELVDSKITARLTKLLQVATVGELNHRANSRELLNDVSQAVIQLAEHSFSVRNIDSLREASLVLQGLPIAEARRIGQYYQALALRRSGKIDESLPLLETIADSAPIAYRARALQTLGAICHVQGKIEEALRLYPEAKRAASIENGRDLLTTLLVSEEIACIKSEMGDHRGALADYENLSPLVRIVSRKNPLYFYLYHNELAVEYAELGRLAEAEAACAIALASPYSHAYPEWSATRDEIGAKRRSASPSIVAVHLPQAEPATHAKPRHKIKPSRVLIPDRSLHCQDLFQRSTFQVPAKTTIVLNAVSILDRMLVCIAARAPPRATEISTKKLYLRMKF